MTHQRSRVKKNTMVTNSLGNTPVPTCDFSTKIIFSPLSRYDCHCPRSLQMKRSIHVRLHSYYYIKAYQKEQKILKHLVAGLVTGMGLFLSTCYATTYTYEFVDPEPAVAPLKCFLLLKTPFKGYRVWS
ncbi:hypothetical protein HanPSC8_Chr03g0089511 [Helianthus annuus]|nr:hypothetical protein HanPSC8_Chr03g0089511 [Helianthus annuus]